MTQLLIVFLLLLLLFLIGALFLGFVAGCWYTIRGALRHGEDS